MWITPSLGWTHPCHPQKPLKCSPKLTSWYHPRQRSSSRRSSPALYPTPLQGSGYLHRKPYPQSPMLMWASWHQQIQLFTYPPPTQSISLSQLTATPKSVPWNCAKWAPSMFFYLNACPTLYLDSLIFNIFLLHSGPNMQSYRVSTPQYHPTFAELALPCAKPGQEPCTLLCIYIIVCAHSLFGYTQAKTQAKKQQRRDIENKENKTKWENWFSWKRILTMTTFEL